MNNYIVELSVPARTLDEAYNWAESVILPLTENQEAAFVVQVKLVKDRSDPTPMREEGMEMENGYKIETIIFFPIRFWRRITRVTYWRSRFLEEQRRADALDSALTSLERSRIYELEEAFVAGEEKEGTGSPTFKHWLGRMND